MCFCFGNEDLCYLSRKRLLRLLHFQEYNIKLEAHRHTALSHTEIDMHTDALDVDETSGQYIFNYLLVMNKIYCLNLLTVQM